MRLDIVFEPLAVSESVYQSENVDRYYFRLIARNGRILVRSSKPYDSKESATQAFLLFREGLRMNTYAYKIEESKDHRYYTTIVSNPKDFYHEVEAYTQTYKYKQSAKRAVSAVKRVALQIQPTLLTT